MAQASLSTGRPRSHLLPAAMEVTLAFLRPRVTPFLRAQVQQGAVGDIGPGAYDFHEGFV